MTERLNVICTGLFNFPIGMAGTKRVRSFVDVIAEKNEVKVITFGMNDANANNEASGSYNNVPYRNFGARLNSSLQYYLLLPFYTLWSMYLVFKWKNKKSRNIIYGYGGTTPEVFILILFARLLNYKIVIDIVEDYEVSLEKNSFFHGLKLKSIVFFEKRISMFADSIVVITSYLEKLYKKRTEGKNIPILTIPVSCQIDEIIPKNKYHDEIKFCYSGTFGHKDGLETLISAFEIFNQKYKNSVLLLIGAGSNMNNILKLSSNKNIKYCGCLVEEYMDFIRDTDVLFMTRVNSGYANAGFPFKLGEYLSTGNPVVCTDVSDISVYLENKVDCIIVEPENEVKLLEAMEFLYTNPQEAFKIGYNGYKKAKRFFNTKTNGEALINFMKKI